MQVVLATPVCKLFIMKFIVLGALFISSFVFTQCRTGKTITKAIAPRDTTAVTEFKTTVDSSILINATRNFSRKTILTLKHFPQK